MNEQGIDSNDFSVVSGFLKSVVNTTFDADKLTQVFFQISRATGQPVTELLEQVKGLDEPKLTATLAAYLNSINSVTILLGIQTPVVPNYHVMRNIRQ